MNIRNFKELPILGIIRGIEEKHVEPLTNAMVNAGLKTVEITMNTENAPSLMKKMRECAKGKLTIGAGTVLSMESMIEALNAGASFIVMPTLVEDVLNYCVQMHIPVFPGALSPNEIFKAWSSGATMVKVFPIKYYGPSYIKEMKGPLDEIEMLACSGVDKNNLTEYFKNGADAISFGGSIFRKELLEKEDYATIENEIQEIIETYKKFKS